MNQIYHPYTKLEEHKAGMWRVLHGPERSEAVLRSAELMRNVDGFLAAMLRVISEWPRSCEMALTTIGLNRRAWLGHAGCCIQTGSPEEPTRQAWHTLTIREQNAANAAADKALTEWERIHFLGADQGSLFDAEDPPPA